MAVDSKATKKCCGCSWTRCLLWTAVVLSAFVAGFHYYLQTKSFIFDQKDIQKIAEEAVRKGLNQSESFAFIVNELRAKHGSHILPSLEFQFINAGGWMGSFGLLHASLTEYVLIFGTEINTGGHSGRYWADIYDTILSGEFRQWKEGATTSAVYGPGVTLHHAQFEATAVQWPAGTWMLEYGRGCIPSTIFFAMADSIFSTQDLWTVGKSIRAYGIAIVSEILQGNF